MWASTTDDNAAYGGKIVQISKEMIETAHSCTVSKCKFLYSPKTKKSPPRKYVPGRA